MAILTSVDGKVYEIPDDKLSRFELPEELLAKLGTAAEPAPPPGDGDGDAAPTELGEDGHADEPKAEDPKTT